jgi:hypothetical protein
MFLVFWPNTRIVSGIAWAKTSGEITNWEGGYEASQIHPDNPSFEPSILVSVHAGKALGRSNYASSTGEDLYVAWLGKECNKGGWSHFSQK